jgi:hypothetical protein
MFLGLTDDLWFDAFRHCYWWLYTAHVDPEHKCVSCRCAVGLWATVAQRDVQVRVRTCTSD